MNIQKKAFRPVYRAIADKQLTEKEAYDILCGIFFQNIQYVPVPTPIVDEEKPTETPVEVRGFMNNK